MSLRIFTTIQGEQKYLDLYDNEPLLFNFSFAEIQDITQKNSAFSQTFIIPGTKKNNEIFNYYFDVNQVPIDYDPNKKFPAIISWDGTEVLEGYIRLDGVTITNDEVEYSVVFYDQIGNLAANIGDKFLADTELSGLSHPYTSSVVLESQLDPDLFPLTGSTDYSYQNGKVFWGLYNIGYVYSGNTQFVDTPITPLIYFSPFTAGTYNRLAGYFDFSGTPVNDFYFKPSIQVKELYSQIVEQAGYKIQSDFFDTSYFKKFYLPLKFNESVYDPNGIKVCYNYTGNSLFINSVFTTITINSNPSSGVFCNNFNYSANTTQVAIAKPGLYDLKIKFTIYETNPGISIWRNGFRIQTSNAPSWQNFFNQGQVFGNGYLTYGNYEVTGTWDSLTATIPNIWQLRFQAQGQFGVSGITIELTSQANYLVSGQTIDYQLEFPDDQYKQIDFITSINRYFNLAVVPSPDFPDTMIIEPIVDYIGKGQVLDWSTKVDYSQTIGIKPTTSLINGTLNYNFQLDNDYANQNFNKSSNRVFGTEQKKLNQDYKDATTDFNLMFSSPVDITLDCAQPSNLTLPSMSKIEQQNNDGVTINSFIPYKTIPRIIFRGTTLPNNNYGFISANNLQTWFLKTYEPTPFTQDRFQLMNKLTTYPFNYWGFSHYLNWRGEDVYQNIIPEFQLEAEDLYDIYYRDYVEDLLSEENKLVSAKIYLYPYEIQQLRFDERILIGNAFYRINKISNYNLLEPAICDIELVKLTREYRPHRKICYELVSCSTGDKLYSNSDLNYNLYAYIGNYVKLYDDNLTPLGCHEVVLACCDEENDYQHYYISSGYTASGVAVYPDCDCTGNTLFNVVQQTTETDNITCQPIPDVTPSPTPSSTPACDCVQGILIEVDVAGIIEWLDCEGNLYSSSFPIGPNVVGSDQCIQQNSLTPVSAVFLINTLGLCCGSPSPTPSVTPTMTPTPSRP